MIEAVDDVMVHTSGAGAKRNFLGVLGISGVEGRPAVPSTWRRQPPVTWSGRGQAVEIGKNLQLDLKWRVVSVVVLSR